jgi:hypothetical protein
LGDSRCGIEYGVFGLTLREPRKKSNAQLKKNVWNSEFLLDFRENPKFLVFRSSIRPWV